MKIGDLLADISRNNQVREPRQAQAESNKANTPGVGHNGGPPLEAAVEGEEVVVTASRVIVAGTFVGLRVVTVIGGAIVGDIFFPSPAGDGKDFISPSDPRWKNLRTQTVDRSQELARIQLEQAAKSQADKAEGNSGWFGFIFNVLSRLTGQ